MSAYPPPISLSKTASDPLPGWGGEGEGGGGALSLSSGIQVLYTFPSPKYLPKYGVGGGLAGVASSQIIPAYTDTWSSVGHAWNSVDHAWTLRGSAWIHMDPRGSAWIRVDPHGPACSHVGPAWIHVDPAWTLRGPRIPQFVI